MKFRTLNTWWWKNLRCKSWAKHT